MAAIKEGQREDEKIEGARLVGRYKDVIYKLKKKFADNNIPLTGKMLMIDCFDGAEHIKTSKKKISFISFNTVMTSKSVVESGQTTSSSFGIVTWMQVSAQEKREVMFPVLRAQ